MTVIIDRDTLKTAITAAFKRTDKTAEYDRYISQAEMTIFRVLRVREMLKRSETSTTDGIARLPADLLHLRRASFLTRRQQKLKTTPGDSIFDYEAMSFDENCDVFYAIEGRDMIIRPKPADNTIIELSFFRRPTPIDANNETNVIFPSVASDIYLFGALWRAYSDVRKTDKAQEELNNMLGAINAANAELEEMESSDQPMSMPSTVQV